MESNQESILKDFKNLAELLLFQATNFKNSRALNFKKNHQLRSFSNQEILSEAFYFACALRHLGLKKGQALGNLSKQNPLWVIVDLGAILAGAITVPIFHNIATEHLFYEIEDSAAEFFFTDDIRIFTLIRDKYPQLKIITSGFHKDGSSNFANLILLGKKLVKEKKYRIEDFLTEINEEDLATIIYTSGSTGKPKGVELTHKNLVSQIKATKEFFSLDENDVALSFLPLSHVFERMVMMFYLSRGVSIYFSEDVKNIANDLKDFNPSIMTVVPRVLEKVFIKIREKIANEDQPIKFLAELAFNRANNKNCHNKQNPLDKIYDFLIYRKFRQSFGTRIRMVICGGAALSEKLEHFYRNIGLNLFCGYGLTETSPVISTNCPGSYKPGTVGKVFPGVEARTTEDGQLLIRGPNVMRGYHNNPKQTAEVIEEGWFKTGDLAEIDQDGFIKIVGRNKEAFKNSNGKYVNPVLIEQKLFQELGFLLGSIIIAEGRNFTSALLFPDFEILDNTKKKFSFIGSDANFLKSATLKKFIQSRIDLINNGLDRWEQIKKFAIISTPISIAGGEITPSMKLKRGVLEEKFKEVIDEFYADSTLIEG
jgi:long-chain acyl-CoA synthetase